MGGYLARPKGAGPWPGVIVLHGDLRRERAHPRRDGARGARGLRRARARLSSTARRPGIELGYDEAGMSQGIKLLMQIRADEAIADARRRGRLPAARARRSRAASSARWASAWAGT